jgi:deoxyribonuclease V
MRIKLKHNLNPSSYQEAVRIQKELKKKLIMGKELKSLKLIAGADISYDKKTKKMYAGVLLFTYPELKLIEKTKAIREAPFPYIPGLLSFREGPALLEAFLKLKSDPDLIMFDGQGIAHPRGFGLAAHMGVVLDTPGIGCAKTRLIGDYTEPDIPAGATSDLMHGGKVIGKVVRTRTNIKPLFVSIGHKINLPQAVEIVLSTCRGLRLPEPTRQAHIYVNQLRKGKR